METEKIYDEMTCAIEYGVGRRAELLLGKRAHYNYRFLNKQQKRDMLVRIGKYRPNGHSIEFPLYVLDEPTELFGLYVFSDEAENHRGDETK